MSSQMEISEVIRKWREGIICYKVAKNLAELCCSVWSKVVPVSDETIHLPEEISKQK